MTALLGLLLAVAEGAELSGFTAKDGTAVEYRLVEPADHDGSTPHPTVLALPPGPQDRSMVDAIVDPWRNAWQADGWVVISPVAPAGRPYYAEGAALIPELLDHVARTHPVEGKVRLFGVSNGGRSAFTVALAHPERFASLVVIPGLPVGEEPPLERLGMPVTLVVGSEDGAWTSGAKRVAAELEALGAAVELVIIEGAGHYVFRSIAYDRLEGWLRR